MKDCEIEREMDSGDLERQLILVSFISGIKFFELKLNQINFNIGNVKLNIIDPFLDP